MDARRIHSQGRRFDLPRVARSFLSRFSEIPTLVEEPEPFPTMSDDYQGGSVLEALADNTDECSYAESVHPGNEFESFTNLEITKCVSTFEPTWRHDDDDEQSLATLEREMDGLRDPIDRLSAREDDLTRWSLGITPTHKPGNPLPLSTAPEELIPPETTYIPPWSNPPPSCGNSFGKTYLLVQRVVDQVYEDMLPARGLDLLDRPTQAGILSVGVDTGVRGSIYRLRCDRLHIAVAGSIKAATRFKTLH
jgi:hypothetical protein